MPDTLNLIAALLGLVASLIAFKSISNGKKTSSGDSKNMDALDGFKKTFNIVGSIVLVMALYFGYMIMMIALPSLMGYAQNIGKKENAKESIIKTIDFTQIKTLNEIKFYSAQSMFSNTNKDKQLDLILESALKDKEYELVVKILSTYFSNTKKDTSIDRAMDHFIVSEEYLYALKASEIYFSNSKKDNQKIRIIEIINTSIQNKRIEEVDNAQEEE